MLAVAVPSCVVPSNTVTVLLASAVPFRVTTLAGETELLLITGADGATVSTVTARAADAALVVPDTVSVAVKLCVPFDKVPVAKLQAPLLFAVTVPSSVAPSYTVHRAAGRCRAGQRQRVVVGDVVAHHAAVSRERRNCRYARRPGYVKTGFNIAVDRIRSVLSDSNCFYFDCRAAARKAARVAVPPREAIYDATSRFGSR